jgi:8-hydroxy-5-deazaflavin:NADPH oxidoreductase
MTVGVVGAGRMGRALARAIASAGVPVMLSTGRDADPGPRPPVPPHCEPVRLAGIWQTADLVILALPFPVARAMMSGLPGRIGEGRALVDGTNPRFCPGSALPSGRSGGEIITEAAPTWRVTKAFNTVPAGLLEAPEMYGRPVSVPIAGAASAKSEVFTLVRRLGFDPLDAGGIAASRELESLAVLLDRVSAAHGLNGRIAIHIGQPEPRTVAAYRSGAA